ncbi:MAG: cystathionine gamma-synthase [Myxococcales bacterium]|nr:cystathionine gamma-synthase [Myxococcales bacterium]
MSRAHEIDTIAIHAAQEPDPATGAIMPPIQLSTTFAQDTPGQHKGYEYARTGNPTRQTLERCAAALEGGAHGVAFASGCAATTTALQLLSRGDHVIACDDVYGGTFRILDRVFVPLGIEVSWVDMTDPAAVSAALTERTRMIWVETPTNPLLKIVDIAALAALAGPEVLLVVDNTFATPVLQRPLELGADLVVHSTTKYLNGHADVVGGLCLTRDDDLAERLSFLQNAVGAVPSPFDCYMVLRGLKTLPLRMRRHCELAAELAGWLERHPAIERVHYPGLPSHPQHALASRQMSLPGGMISAVVRGGLPAAARMLERVELFVCAESLGGVESLIEHPASMTHAAVPPQTRAQLGISDGLVRLSVGIEAAADLRADLDRALS